MNSYDFLEERYSNSLTDEKLADMLLYELDLSSVTDKFKETISKLNLSAVNMVFNKVDNKLSNKLKEFDVDPNKIKKSAKKSAKEIYSIIDSGYKKKIPSKIIAKKIDRKIKASITDQIEDSGMSGIKTIIALISAVAIMLFAIEVILIILHAILGLNFLLSYILILLFVFKIFDTSFSLVVKWIGADSDSTVVSYRKKLKNVSISKYDETSNEKLYMLHVFIDSFKNVLQKIKK